MNRASKTYPLMPIFAFTAFGTFIYGIGRYAYGLYIPKIGEMFHVGTATLGFIASAGTVVFILTTLLSSFVLTQRMRASWMLGIGGSVTSLGCFLVYIAHSPTVLFLGIILATSCVGIAPPAQYRIFDRHLSQKWQMRAIACINCAGTMGVLIVGALSYSLPGHWQRTWLVFSGCALIVTVIAIVSSPAEGKRQETLEVSQTINFNEIFQSKTVNLFILCLSYGVLLGCYYTYSAKLLAQYGGYTARFQETFWMIVGISGLTTVFSGDYVHKMGVRATLILAHALNVSACVFIVLFIKSELAVVLSAVVFGVGSMLPGSAILIWSMRIYRNRPTIAFGVMFAFLSAGQALGSAVSGIIGDTLSLGTAFMMSAVVVIVSLFFIPKLDREDDGEFRLKIDKLDNACAVDRS